MNTITYTVAGKEIKKEYKKSIRANSAAYRVANTLGVPVYVVYHDGRAEVINGDRRNSPA